MFFLKGGKKSKNKYNYAGLKSFLPSNIFAKKKENSKKKK